MITSRLRLLPIEQGVDGGAARAALQAAMDGTGPAIVPVPRGPGGAAVVAMAQPDLPLEPGADGHAVAVVVPTSGTTGEPKGALLTGAALRASASATLDRLGGPGRWLLALPLTHIAGLQVLVRSVLAGVEPVELPSAGGFTAAAFVASVDRLGGARRYTALVPTQLRRLVEGPIEAREALASFDAVLVGGAALDDELRDRADEAGARIVATYGMTETCGGCVYDGLPLDGVRVHAPTNAPVQLGGQVVFSGYRLRPDLTAGALVTRDGSRWHVTSDLGGLDSAGRLHVLGRVDDMIVSGGENVAPVQVEAALGSHSAVKEVAVLGVPDDDWGQRVVAVVVWSDRDGPGDLSAVRAYASSVLPRHSLPRQWVTVAALPLLPSGKTDRAAIRRMVGATTDLELGEGE